MNKIRNLNKKIDSMISDQLFNEINEIEAKKDTVDYDKKIDVINDEIDKLNKEEILLYNSLFDLPFLKEKNVLNVSGKYDINRAVKIVKDSTRVSEETIIAAMETAQECNMKLKFCYLSRHKAAIIYDRLKLLKGIKLRITKEIDDTVEDNLKAEMNDSYTKIKYILSFYDLKKECLDRIIEKLEEYKKNDIVFHFYSIESFDYFYIYCRSKRECQKYIKEFELLDTEVKYEIVELKGSKNGNA